MFEFIFLQLNHAASSLLLAVQYLLQSLQFSLVICPAQSSVPYTQPLSHFHSLSRYPLSPHFLQFSFLNMSPPQVLHFFQNFSPEMGVMLWQLWHIPLTSMFKGNTNPKSLSFCSPNRRIFWDWYSRDEQLKWCVYCRREQRVRGVSLGFIIIFMWWPDGKLNEVICGRVNLGWEGSWWLLVLG